MPRWAALPAVAELSLPDRHEAAGTNSLQLTALISVTLGELEMRSAIKAAATCNPDLDGPFCH